VNPQHWLEELNAANRRWALREEERIFGRERKRAPKWLRERRADEIWMISGLDLEYILHVQPNFSQSSFRQLSGLGWHVGIEKIWQKLRRRLEELDAFLNIRLLLRGWRLSPFRLEWIAYIEEKQGVLHSHIALGVHPVVAKRFAALSGGLIDSFNKGKRSDGCTLELHPINNRRKQIRYCLKKIKKNEMYKRRIFSKEFEPAGWPALIKKGSKWVRKDLKPRPKHWPIDWSERNIHGDFKILSAPKGAKPKGKK
jgi:hypothetical protein